MPERLTESLIRRGVLDEQQANEAMERQVIQGGALDTSLLELELVSEQDVVDALASAYGLSASSPEQAVSPPDLRAVRAFPEQWAKKHMLAPLALDAEASVLSVLTPAPADLNLIARLGELLDLTIEPLLAPEFRVWQRIVHLYGTEPPDRLLPLIDRHGNVPETSALPESSGVAEKPKTLAPLEFGEAVNALRDARHRDDIAETTLRYASKDLELVALFIVHPKHVDGWMGIGPGAGKVPKLPIELKADSAFRVVLDTQAHYLGPLPSDPLHVEFLERLGRPEPRAVLIVPIRIRSRTVALLYGENGNQTIAPRLAADLMLFTTHVQGALESLLIRKKAESISDLSARPAKTAEMPKQIQLVVRTAAAPAPDESEPPRHEVTSGNGTEYAYVRSKTNGEVAAPATPEEVQAPVDGAQVNEPLEQEPALEPLPDDDELDVVVEEEPPRGDTDELASSFLPQAELAPEVEEEEDEGWDSVDIKPSAEVSSSAAAAANQAHSNEVPSEDAPADEATEASAQDANGEAQPILPGNAEELEIPQDAYAGFVLAESADGGALLDELSDLDEPEPPPPQVGELDEGWDDVQVETWDEFGHRAQREAALQEDETLPNLEAERWIERGYRELQAMRESLGEDSTVPDLSAEAWIRAASDVTRARPLPQEVVDRAALPAEESGIPSAAFRGVVRAEELEPMGLGEELEPVPLTQRTTASYAARGLAPSEPVVMDEEQDDVRAHHDRVVDDDGNVVPTEDLEPPAPAEAPPPKSEVELLVEQVVSANPTERKTARERLRELGPDVLPAVAEVFPGVVDIDPLGPSSQLPPFAECGALPWLMAHHGAESHPLVVRRLDAPEPIRRFFAVYYYSAVFVPEVIPRLIQRLHDEESRICMLAARTLFAYREHPDFTKVLDHLHGRLEATSVTGRRHAAYLIGLFRDVTAIPKLIDVFERKEKALFEVAEDALAEITKQRFGPNPKKWRTWWSKNQSKSRIAWLIDGLTSKDAALRKSAAEELRAVTGLDMGYDDSAPKRQREESRQRWVKWWEEQASA